MIPTSHPPTIPQSEPSEQQRVSEAFLASRRSIPSPTSRAICASPPSRAGEKCCDRQARPGGLRVDRTGLGEGLAALLRQRVDEELIVAFRFTDRASRI